MKTPNEIVFRIGEARKIILRSDYEDADRLCGWLLGLGMVKGLLHMYEIYHDELESVEYEIKIILTNLNPKSPYEQGIKEALEWCIGEGE